MKEELSNGKKFVDNAEKIDKSFSEIRHLFITAPEDELIGMITNLNPHISLKKRYIRIYHDLIILTSRRIGKEATQRLAENSCQSFYYRHYYLFLYYFLLVRLPLEKLLEDASFDLIQEIYEDNEPIKKLSDVEFECIIQGEDEYYYPIVAWNTIQYYAFMDANAEYLKWEEIPNAKKSTKGYQETELIEKQLNIYVSETKNSEGVYQLKLLVSKGSKARSERSRKRFYGTIKISKKKDYVEEFHLIDKYYDRLAQNKKYSIKEYLVEEEITKTYFFKLKNEYFKQKPLNKYYKAYKFINSNEYDGNFSKVKQDYKISKRKMDIFVNRYFPKFYKS